MGSRTKTNSSGRSRRMARRRRRTRRSARTTWSTMSSRRPRPVRWAPARAVRRFVRTNLRTARAGAQRTGLGRLDDIVDHVVRAERRVRLLRLAMRRERPDEFVFVLEPIRDLHSENEAVAPRQKVCRLALIGAGHVETVVGPNRHVDLFFPVPFNVAEQQLAYSIRRLLPPYLRVREVLAAVIA